MTTPAHVKIGSEFRYPIMDSNPLFKVTEVNGQEVVAEAVSEPIEIGGKTYPGDHDGMIKAFLHSDVEAAIRHQQAWENIALRVAREEADFWGTVKPGQELHLHNFGNTFVQGRVVIEDNEKVFLPKALVGDWHASDLPRRNPDGTPYRPYWVRKIHDRETSRPNYRNFYEANPKEHKVNPATLEENPLDLPSVTAAEQAEYARVALLDRLAAIAQDHTASSEERLSTIKKLATWPNPS